MVHSFLCRSEMQNKQRRREFCRSHRSLLGYLSLMTNVGVVKANLCFARQAVSHDVPSCFERSYFQRLVDSVAPSPW